MKLFQRRDLERLLETRSAPCLSLYMPTERHYPQTDQNAIRYKNLVRQAADRLGGLGDSPGVARILAQLEAVGHLEFWRSPREGVAVFVAGDLLVHYRLPIRPPERVVVADSFHVKPLVELLAINRRWFVLSLSIHDVRLHQGNAYGLSPVELSHVPGSIDEVINPDKAQPFASQHTAGAGSPTGVGLGHGSAIDQKKAEATTFFRRIDDAVIAALPDEPAPLLVAAALPYLPMYLAQSRYPALVAGGIEASFAHNPLEELEAKARERIGAWFREREDEAIAEYDKGFSRGQGTNDVSAIAQAAVQGRVWRLFLAEGAELWGTLDRTTGAVRTHAAQETGDDDLLDEIGEMVLAKAGEVLLLPRERVPGLGPAAALLRW